MRVGLLCVALLALLALAPFVSAKHDDVLAKIAAERAAVTPEEVARQLADNTITNANLLPTRPAPKDWKYSGEPEFALLMTPGLGKTCNLKKYPNLQKFLKEDAHFYPNLKVEYSIVVDPKLKFYATAEQRDGALIHGATLSEEELLALLMAGPDETKEPLLNVELSDEDPSPETLREMLAAHGLQRSFLGDENHSARLIFRPDFVPMED